MSRTLDIVLHSDYSPDTCASKLAGQIDLDQRTLLSFSGYKGSKPILGRVAGNEFRLHKRRYWHNSFGPVLFGRMTSDGRGALIEAYWAMWRSVRVFIRIWLGGVAVIGSPIFIASLYQWKTGQHEVVGDLWVGLIVPPALILWGLVLPRLGAALSSYERKHIVRLLQETLVAGQTAVSSQKRDWNSRLDDFRLWV